VDPRQRLGAHGEELAARHLVSRGYEIVDRNFRTRFGELDLIAAGQGCLVFCEVKTRVSSEPADTLGPLASVGARKRRQVRQMAREWLAERRSGLAGGLPQLCGRFPDLRFDAIGVTVDRGGELVGIEHLDGAF
jgi:putative endonuclease